MTQPAPAAEVLGGGQRTRVGVGLIGFGWLGQAHSRSVQRMPTLFADRVFDAELVICADNVAGKMPLAKPVVAKKASSARRLKVIEAALV